MLHWPDGGIDSQKHAREKGQEIWCVMYACIVNYSLYFHYVFLDFVSFYLSLRICGYAPLEFTHIEI